MDAFQEIPLQHEVFEFETFSGSNILYCGLALILGRYYASMHLGLWPRIFAGGFGFVLGSLSWRAVCGACLSKNELQIVQNGNSLKIQLAGLIRQR